MASPQTIERQRGIKEAGQQLGALREKWPLAFPVQAQDVRPLALGVAHQVAAEMGWSLPYTPSVLRHWKMAPVSREPNPLPALPALAYRSLRADRRTAFLLAAAARFDALRGFARDSFFETRKTVGALRRLTWATAAGASCSTAIAAGASS